VREEIALGHVLIWCFQLIDLQFSHKCFIKVPSWWPSKSCWGSYLFSWGKIGSHQSSLLLTNYLQPPEEKIEATCKSKDLCTPGMTKGWAKHHRLEWMFVCVRCAPPRGYAAPLNSKHTLNAQSSVLLFPGKTQIGRKDRTCSLRDVFPSVAWPQRKENLLIGATCLSQRRSRFFVWRGLRLIGVLWLTRPVDIRREQDKWNVFGGGLRLFA